MIWNVWSWILCWINYMKCMMLDTLLNPQYEMYDVGYFVKSTIWNVWCWIPTLLTEMYEYNNGYFVEWMTWNVWCSILCWMNHMKYGCWMLNELYEMYDFGYLVEWIIWNIWFWILCLINDMKCMMFNTLLNEWYEMYDVGCFI